jgi:hypothetical protein
MSTSTYAVNNSAATYFELVRRNLEWTEDVRHLLDNVYDLETGLSLRENFGKHSGYEFPGEAYRMAAVDFVESSLRTGQLIRPPDKRCLLVYEALQQDTLCFLVFTILQKENEGVLIIDEFAAYLSAASHMPQKSKHHLPIH